MNNHCNSKLTNQRMRRSICAPWIVLLLLLALPAAVQAQFTYTTNNGSITITGYTGQGGAVTIPDTINGLPVTDIGRYALGVRQPKRIISLAAVRLDWWTVVWRPQAQHTP